MVKIEVLARLRWLELERRRRLSDVGLAKSPPSSKDDDEVDKSVLNESDRGVYYAVLARLFSDIEAREDEDAQIHAAGMAGSPGARNSYGSATPTPKKIRGRSVEVVMQLLKCTTIRCTPHAG